MKKELINWLHNIEKLDGKPPVEVIAYNLGLFKSDMGFMMYLVGAFEYSEEDDDWACIKPPSKSYRYLKFPNEIQTKTWEKILEYSENVLKELELSGALNNTFLSNAKAITTGFDDGDLIRVR